MAEPMSVPDMYTCVPGPQSVHDWHSKLRLVSAYRPSGHASQLVEFSAEAAVPSAHSSQETDAVLCADVPLGHGSLGPAGWRGQFLLPRGGHFFSGGAGPWGYFIKNVKTLF